MVYKFCQRTLHNAACLTNIVACLLLVCLPGPVAAATITDARMWRAPDHTRLVFDLNGPVQHKILSLNNPARLVIDIEDARLGTDLSAVELGSSPISKIRSAVQDKKNLRVVLDLTEAVKPRSFPLSATSKAGHRLVIDLYDQKSSTVKNKAKTSADVRNQQRDVIIAIDAGHGGEDPGAIGHRGIKEKQVVMAIARELEKQLLNTRGFKPILIRNGDYYLGLRDRGKLARKYNADFFVSIHADAFRNPNARGSSVYILSQKGATSTAAQFLADKENDADLLGGVDLNDKDAVLSEVLMDLSMTYKQSASVDVGTQVLGAISKVSHLHSSRVEKAAFVVLKTPDIPSMLIETGYLSNPKEARLLNTGSHQKKMAHAIYQGIAGYFKDNPPDGTYLASLRELNPREYVIASGDTLSGIANRYSVSLAMLRRHNGLKNDHIRVGQRIIIPSS